MELLNEHLCRGSLSDKEFILQYKRALTTQKKTDKRDDSVVGSSDCSSREPKFDPQHPHGSSQQSVTLVPEDPMPSSGFSRHQACTWYTNIHVDKTLIHVTFNF